MPAKSKKQFKFMAMVANGVKKIRGLSKKVAKYFEKHVNYKSLPIRKGKGKR